MTNVIQTEFFRKRSVVHTCQFHGTYKRLAMSVDDQEDQGCYSCENERKHPCADVYMRRYIELRYHIPHNLPDDLFMKCLLGMSNRSA